MFERPDLRVTVATINYDRVIEQFLQSSDIQLQTGFDENGDICPWVGFDSETLDDHGPFLKLHGSLDWFSIQQMLFKQAPQRPAANQIYKIRSGDVLPHLKDGIRKQLEKEPRRADEFLSPRLIVGGLKDRKILDIPFVEIQREWQIELSRAHTLVLVGTGVTDTHLMDQIRGLLINNSEFDKIIVVNPDKQARQGYKMTFQNRAGRRVPYSFIEIDAYWNLPLIEETVGVGFDDMVYWNGGELSAHAKSVLPERAEQ